MYKYLSARSRAQRSGFCAFEEIHGDLGNNDLEDVANHRSTGLENGVCGTDTIEFLTSSSGCRLEP